MPTSQPMNLWEQHIHRSSCIGQVLMTGMAASIEVLLLETREISDKDTLLVNTSFSPSHTKDEMNI